MDINLSNTPYYSQRKQNAASLSVFEVDRFLKKTGKYQKYAKNHEKSRIFQKIDQLRKRLEEPHFIP